MSLTIYRADGTPKTTAPGGLSVPMDGWHTVGGASEPAFQNGWAAGAINPVQFRKDPLGRVWIRGSTTSAGASAATMFVLPVGYRPARQQLTHNVQDNDAAGTYVNLLATGEVQVTHSAGLAVYLDLSFDTEAVTVMPTGPAGPQGLTGPTGGNATVPIDPWHNVGAAGEPAFNSGFSNFDVANDERVAFRKDPLGKVLLRGKMFIGTNLDLSAFTLPVGYRPPHNYVRFPVIGFTSAGVGIPGYIYMAAVGSIAVAGGTFGGGTPQAVDLSSVEFDTDTVTAMPTGPQGPQGVPGIPVPVVSSLPPTTGLPDGYEVYYKFNQVVGAPAANPEPRIWHLRYDASQAGASKWVPVGAQEPVTTYDSVARSVAAGVGFIDYTPNAIYARAPIGGLYRITFGTDFMLASVSQNLYTALNINGVWATFASIGSGQPATWSTAAGLHRAVVNAASDVYWGASVTVAGTISSTGRYVALHPVLLTGPT